MLSAIQLLRTHLPTDCLFDEPTGGYFIWIRFPAAIDVNELNAFARTHYRVSAIAGNVFSAANKFHNCIRISIAFFGGEKLRLAIVEMCRAYVDFASKLNAKELKQWFGEASVIMEIFVWIYLIDTFVNNKVSAQKF